MTSKIDLSGSNAEPNASGHRKPWHKPVIVTATVRDHTEDGYTTGTDDGNGNNDFTLS